MCSAAVQSSAFRLLDDGRLLNDDQQADQGGNYSTIHNQALLAGEGRRTSGVPKRAGGPDPL